jgi:hypothetical protein
LHTFWFCFPLDDHVALRAFNANFSLIFLTRDLSPLLFFGEVYLDICN